MPYKDREKQREAYRRWYLKHREEQIARVHKDRLRIIRSKKMQLIAMLGGKCNICGYAKNVAALCFHHTDPKVKDGNPSALLRDRTIKSINLNGWVLLCQNCHAELHHPELSIDRIKS